MSNYKTAMGRTVNMEQLRAKNQRTRAVGNMNVDAAGNTLDSNNEIISDSSRRVSRVYNRATQNPSAVARPVQQPPKRTPKPQAKELDLSTNELQQMNDWDSEEPVGKNQH